MSFLSKLTADGSATWEELIEPTPSPTILSSRESKRATRVFRVAQADLAALELECFPPSSFLPGRHPTFTRLYVNDYTANPMPGHTLVDVGSGGHSEPDYWMVTVNYSSVEIEEPTDLDGGGDLDAITGSVSFTTETMTLPGYGGLKWETTGTVIKEPEVSPFLVIPVSQWSLLVPRVASIPWGPMRANRGKINANAFHNAAPETVLYTGMNVSFRFSPDGSRQYDIEHHFSERQIIWNGATYGWNHYYDSTNKRFDRIVNTAGNPFYSKSTGFNSLLAF